jgi:hypothetical protein
MLHGFPLSLINVSHRIIKEGGLLIIKHYFFHSLNRMTFINTDSKLLYDFIFFYLLFTSTFGGIAFIAELFRTIFCYM